MGRFFVASWCMKAIFSFIRVISKFGENSPYRDLMYRFSSTNSMDSRVDDPLVESIKPADDDEDAAPGK